MFNKDFIQSTTAPIEKMRASKPKNDNTQIWDLAIDQIKMLNQYYAEALDQANKSFWLAVLFALVGLGVFALAAVSILKGESASNSLISGAVVEVVSGVGFYLHGKSLSAMTDNSNKMDRMQRYLLAYALSEKLEDEITALTELIKAIASEK
jgi:uncharacterized membrane-anchored protein